MDLANFNALSELDQEQYYTHLKDREENHRNHMIFRCQEDVKINTLLWNDQLAYLLAIYNGDIDEVNRIIDYLTFKLDCAREQEEVRWRLDIDKTNENLSILVNIKDEKMDQLTESMPARTLYAKMDYPAKPYKKNGALSTVGTRWHEKLVSLGLPEDHTDSIRFPKGEEPGNPNSHDQLKDWLFSLGWVPMTFNHVPIEEVINGVKVKTKQTRAVPQISDDGKLCQSVRLLIEANPQLEALNGLFIVSHRISILNGYLENVSEDGYLKAEISGFTNTLRFKHKVLVNLPTIAKPYGDMMRGVLIADEGYVLCGSDMSSLEDSTKRHYMFFYDPEYVIEMTREDYDPHLSVARAGELVTDDEIKFYQWYEKNKPR